MGYCRVHRIESEGACTACYAARARECARCGAPFVARFASSRNRYCGRVCSTRSYVKTITPLPVRFWRKVKKGAGCWLWKGHVQANGYGSLSIGRGVSQRAHRLAWELTNGPIPDDLWVLHRCDVRACVNPAHLFLGTAADNMRDMNQKGRNNQGGWQKRRHQ